MKLNKKNTVLVGLAFLSISAFWQMYDNVIPLMLKGTFRLDEALTGAVMAADNILALFLLPFFGALSDRTSTKIGRRMPFILCGTAAAVVLMNLLPLLDNRYAAAPSPGTRAAFVVLLGLLLIAMGTYRSPAVALMPDVTVKPLRSKGNAVINLMGAVGGVLYLAAAAALYSDERVGGLAHVDYRLLFAIVSGIMVLSVLTLFLTVREPALAAQAAAYEAAHPEEITPDGAPEPAVSPPLHRPVVHRLQRGNHLVYHLRPGADGPGAGRGLHLPDGGHGRGHRVLYPHRRDLQPHRPQADDPGRRGPAEPVLRRRLCAHGPL